MTTLKDNLNNFSFYFDKEILSRIKDYNIMKFEEVDFLKYLTRYNFNSSDHLGIFIYVHQMFLFCEKVLENISDHLDTISQLENIFKNGYSSLCDDFNSIGVREINYENIFNNYIQSKSGVEIEEKANESKIIFNFDSSDTNPELKVIKLNYKIIMKGLYSNGRLNIFIRTHLLLALIRSLDIKINFEEILSSLSQMEKELVKQIELAESMYITEEQFSSYFDVFINSREKIPQTLKTLRKFLNLFLNLNEKNSIKKLECLYIKLIGHFQKEVRNEAVLCLNMLYDNTLWQEKTPFVSIIKNLQEKILIEVFLRKKDLIKDGSDNIVLITNFPNKGFTWLSQKNFTEIEENIIKMTFDLGTFNKCGYYDWSLVKFKEGTFSPMKCAQDPKLISELREAKGRFIVINKNVKDLSIHEVFCDLINANIDHKGNFNKRGTFSDLESKLEEYSQKYINCLYVMGALERDNQIVYDEKTCEVIDIADSLSSPMAITCRASISSLLGGDKAFSSLIKKSKKFSIKILVDMLARVSSSRFHRKYRNILLNTIDEKGKVNNCYGTDGHSVSYEDSAMLNYRKIESWELICQDIIQLASKHQIDGVHLDNCQSWPQIMQIDDDEMLRVDCDGQPAYSALDILNGEVVIRNEDSGYWNSDLYDQYPNPFLLKITKTVWQQFPEFIFVGECWGGQKFNNRHLMLARSGVVPKMYSLPRALSSVFGRKIHRNGDIELCKPAPVTIIKEYLSDNYRFLPEGSVLIQSSCGQIWPYPALLYGRGNWSAVDLLFSLPDVPMTFMEEINGEAYRVQITNVYQQKEIPKVFRSSKSKSSSGLKLFDKRIDSDENSQSNVSFKSSSEISTYDELRSIVNSLVTPSGIDIKNVKQLQAKQESIVKEVGPEFGFDLNKINYHYNHRRKLRSMHECLRRGELIFLNVQDSNHEPHPHVLAFARHCPEETGIIAINLSSNVSAFKLDLKALLPLFEYEVNFNSACYIEDWIREERGDFYFIREVISEGHSRTLNVSIQ
jgi:hypothetical protein